MSNTLPLNKPAYGLKSQLRQVDNDASMPCKTTHCPWSSHPTSALSPGRVGPAHPAYTASCVGAHPLYPICERANERCRIYNSAQQSLRRHTGGVSCKLGFQLHYRPVELLLLLLPMMSVMRLHPPGCHVVSGRLTTAPPLSQPQMPLLYCRPLPYSGPRLPHAQAAPEPQPLETTSWLHVPLLARQKTSL